jgi:hypothetical protein
MSGRSKGKKPGAGKEGGGKPSLGKRRGNRPAMHIPKSKKRGKGR